MAMVTVWLVLEANAAPMSAHALYQAYDANGVAADRSYKGKTLDVAGSIANIGKDILGSPFITLATGDQLGNVQCTFGRGRKDEAIVAALNKGQAVVVRGKVDGKLINVLLSKCTVISK
jgi:hypothetical protein